jgi:hypothetical protein
MKKTIIGALVGAIIIFLWQFLSFAAANFHKPAQQYTEKQTAILDFLNSQGLEEGGYVFPGMPDGSSREQHEALMKEANGKPWAMVQYHKSNEATMSAMIMNMIRGFLVNIVIMLLFIWIIRRMTAPSFGQILTCSLFVGLIVFFNAPYTGHIWYKTFDVWAFFMDALISWGIVGIWLGWWMRRA